MFKKPSAKLFLITDQRKVKGAVCFLSERIARKSHWVGAPQHLKKARLDGVNLKIRQTRMLDKKKQAAKA